VVTEVVGDIELLSVDDDEPLSDAVMESDALAEAESLWETLGVVDEVGEVESEVLAEAELVGEIVGEGVPDALAEDVEELDSVAVSEPESELLGDADEELDGLLDAEHVAVLEGEPEIVDEAVTDEVADTLALWESVADVERLPEADNETEPLQLAVCDAVPEVDAVVEFEGCRDWVFSAVCVGVSESEVDVEMDPDNDIDDDMDLEVVAVADAVWVTVALALCVRDREIGRDIDDELVNEADASLEFVVEWVSDKVCEVLCESVPDCERECDVVNVLVRELDRSSVNESDNEAVCVELDVGDALPELELLPLTVPEALCDELTERVPLRVRLECVSDGDSVTVRRELCNDSVSMRGRDGERVTEGVLDGVIDREVEPCGDSDGVTDFDMEPSLLLVFVAEGVGVTDLDLLPPSNEYETVVVELGVPVTLVLESSSDTDEDRDRGTVGVTCIVVLDEGECVAMMVLVSVTFTLSEAVPDGVVGMVGVFVMTRDSLTETMSELEGYCVPVRVGLDWFSEMEYVEDNVVSLVNVLVVAVATETRHATATRIWIVSNSARTCLLRYRWNMIMMS
jgi:hypothetical protein